MNYVRHTLSALVLVLAFAPRAGAQQATAHAVDAVAAVGMTVSDLDRSIEFYESVLTFDLLEVREAAGPDVERLFGVFGARIRMARLRLGSEEIELVEFLVPSGRPIPVDSRSNDRWFQHVAIIVNDMDRAYERLRNLGVQHASTGPQLLPDWNPNAGGIEAFYFRDPDGHNLELLAFPTGKGDPKWHVPSDRLFLGIDHTAIVVHDTEASKKFYADLLGFAVAGESENYGPEQERLNNVFGARLRITALRPPAGPLVELLEYLAPGDGRPMPLDTRANDLWHWHITMRADIEALDPGIRAGRYQYVSPGAQRFPNAPLGYSTGLMVQDPDGHAVLFTSN